MLRCLECGERLPGDADQYGARCPSCREPLHDAPPRRRGPADGQCAAHPENPAYGTCGRCGNYLCDVCRTRWRDRWLCPACVELTLEGKEALPAEARDHLRQALLALGLGLCSWLIILLAFAVALAGRDEGEVSPYVALAGLLLLASPLPSALGLGQAIAAIRARGDHMILATIGLILSGVTVGLVIGLLSFAIALQI